MKKGEEKKRAMLPVFMWNKRKFFLILIDLAIYAVTYMGMLGMAVLLTDTAFGNKSYLANACLFGAVLFIARMVGGSYHSVTRYSNARSYLNLVICDAIGGMVGLGFSYLFKIAIGAWQSVSIVAVFCLVTLSARFFYQCLYQHLNAVDSEEEKENHKIGVAIVGAGQVGVLLAEELLYHPSHYKPVCFIDKDGFKVGNRVCGLPVYREGESAIEVLKSLPVQEIFIALPSINSDTAKELHTFYSRTGCKVKLYDFPMNDRMEQQGSKRVMRELRIEDLLFRDPLHFSSEEAKTYYRDRVVLVTGGGGSIGSELCRQIAKCGPAQLIIFDIYENNAYEIQQELIRIYGEKLDLRVEIGSVRDRKRLESVFENYHPQVVFHAAAHKHVPLMEHSNCEVVKNNILGTYHAADMAEKYGAEKFILISTDKAVNPTNIMGASKRMCEMVIQCRHDSKTSFAAVRFGNVLGSNGSVIPLFKKQIADGGPVTITDKRIVRYFMTIPEASQLVMQAGAMAKSGELFVLDMGKPVRILDLAENMIRLSGLMPEVDIKIKEIGLRPGEKLYEELLIKTENLDKTDNSMIFVERDEPLTREEVDRRIALLCEAVEEAKDELESVKVKDALKKAVPTYHNPDSVNQKAAEAEEMKLCAATIDAQ